MKTKIFFTALVFGLVGTAVAAATYDSVSLFNAKKSVIESVVEQRYTGTETVVITLTEKEIKESWLPYVKELFEKDKVLKGSYFKEVDLQSDGSIKLTGYLGQGVKNYVKVPFVSNVYVTFKPTVADGALKIQVQKIKVGFFPVSIGLAQKLMSRWKIDLNDFTVKLKNFTFEKMVVTDNDITMQGKYQAPKKIAPTNKK